MLVNKFFGSSWYIYIYIYMYIHTLLTFHFTATTFGLNGYEIEILVNIRYSSYGLPIIGILTHGIGRYFGYRYMKWKINRVYKYVLRKKMRITFKYV